MMIITFSFCLQITASTVLFHARTGSTFSRPVIYPETGCTTTNSLYSVIVIVVGLLSTGWCVVVLGGGAFFVSKSEAVWCPCDSGVRCLYFSQYRELQL